MKINSSFKEHQSSDQFIIQVYGLLSWYHFCTGRTYQRRLLRGNSGPLIELQLICYFVEHKLRLITFEIYLTFLKISRREEKNQYHKIIANFNVFLIGFRKRLVAVSTNYEHMFENGKSMIYIGLSQAACVCNRDCRALENNTFAVN